MHPAHLLQLAHGCTQARRRPGASRIVLAGQDEPTTPTTTQGGNRCLIALGDSVIHPAKVGVGIGGTRRTNPPPGQVPINHQGATFSHQGEHFALDEGVGDCVKHALNGG